MSFGSERTSLVFERREDFKIETYRHLEEKIGKIRRSVMDLAAQHARGRQPDTEVYRVEPQDIDRAFTDLLSQEGTLAQELEVTE